MFVVHIFRVHPLHYIIWIFLHALDYAELTGTTTIFMKFIFVFKNTLFSLNMALYSVSVRHA
jgi:hypothetical protein